MVGVGPKQIYWRKKSNSYHEHRMTVQHGQCGFLSSTELRPPILLAKSSLVRNMAFTVLFFFVNTPWKIKVWNPKIKVLEPQKSRFGTQKSRFGVDDVPLKIGWKSHGVNFPGCTWVLGGGSCAVGPAFNLYQEVGTWLETEQRRNNRVVLFNYTLELFINFQIIFTPLSLNMP